MKSTKKSSTEIDKHIGAAVREARKRRGYSQERLGKELGLTFQQIQKYEKGTNRVSAGTLARIAAILNTHVLDFFPADAVDRAAPREPLATVEALQRRVREHERSLGEIRKIVDSFGGEARPG